MGERGDTAKAPLLHDCFFMGNEKLAYQRVTTAEWRSMLLSEYDKPIIRGNLRQIVGKNLGAGVVELRLVPLALAGKEVGK